jgi:kynurenine--oxoglutarate transaminase/cysteine-S-conjugate beta-lyase/glutamine--phenylpyruvate transaminase
MVKLAGGTPIYIALKPDTKRSDKLSSLSTSSASWTLDMEELSQMFNFKTKAIIINTPNNPLGKMFSLEELTVRNLIFILNILTFINIPYKEHNLADSYIVIC